MSDNKKYKYLEPIKSSTDDWIDQFSDKLAAETMNTLITQGNMRGSGVAHKAFVVFVARLIGLAVWKSLNLKTKIENPTDKQQYQFTSDNYRDMKVSVQNAVAAGFTAAFKSFTSKEVEYYCDINPVSEPLNKLPC